MVILLSLPIVTSLLVKPTVLITNMSLGEADIEKLPFSSEVVPREVPFTVIDTDGTDLPNSSITFPFIVVCASDLTVKAAQKTKDKIAERAFPLKKVIFKSRV